MPTKSEIQEQIVKLGNLPKILRNSVEGLNDEQLDTTYREGGWTIRQVTHHIMDSHVHGYIRMKFTLTEENPTLKPYDENIWAKQKDGAENPVEDSILVLEGLHKRWSDWLNSLVAEDVWERPSLHLEEGKMSFWDLLKDYAWHGEHHVKQILGLREQMNW